jgi:hypothetical protein
MLIATFSSSTISVYGESKHGPTKTQPTEKYEGADPYKETIEAVRASGFKTVWAAKGALRNAKPRNGFPEKL